MWQRTTRLPLLVGVIAAALVTAPAKSLPATQGDYSLIDVLVWGADLRIDISAYRPDIRDGIRQLLDRSASYQSKRAKPKLETSLEGMVYDAEVRYERKLYAIATARGAADLAFDYVSQLHPCYEWEGYHDCPQREATFAASYRTAHPDGPFSQYLPLLEAHRWLCAAEAYDYEKSPRDAERSRQSYRNALAVARRSKLPLVRKAAEELATRGSC